MKALTKAEYALLERCSQTHHRTWLELQPRGKAVPMLASLRRRGLLEESDTGAYRLLPKGRQVLKDLL